MGKSMIIEAQDSSLVYEEGQKGVLGKLSGVFANFRTGTRNGGRLYNEELVDKRIFGNEDVMEALETRTLFGELDHPEGDRCETLAQNAAVSIVKLEKDAEEGVVKGEALILDTPSGRTLKALVDSGAKMGISSRGIGEEIISEGQTIIDPDTYDFITFDIVVTPANKGARLSLVEGKQKDTKLYKSIEKEINECVSLNQLDQLNKVVESNIPVGKLRLKKLIENKITTLTSDEDITGANSEDINKGNEDIIPNKVQEGKEVEKSTDKLTEQKLAENELQEASTKLLDENKSLVEKVDKLEKSNKLLEAKLISSRKAEKQAKLSLRESKSDLTKSKETMLESNERTIMKLKKINESKVKNLEESYKDEIKNLNKKLEESIAEKDRLLESNKNLAKKVIESKKETETIKSKLNESNKKLEEKAKLEEQIKLLESKVEQAEQASKSKIEESKKLQNKTVEDLQNKLNDANSQISKLTEANNRISKLPFNVTKANLKFEGLAPEAILEDDEQALFNTMVEMNQKK